MIRAAECVSRSIDIQPGFVPATMLKDQILKAAAENLKSVEKDSDEAFANGDATSAVQIISSALSQTPWGEPYDNLTLKGMNYVAKLQTPLRMSKEAQQYFLRGQAILKNAKTTQDIKEALGQYLWALRYAPLSPDIHLSLSSIYASLKLYREALHHSQAYLTTAQSPEKLDAAIEKYYELQYFLDKEQNDIRSAISE